MSVPLDFTEAQETVLDLSGGLLVTAGAGSGKTSVLVERYVRLLGKPGHDPVSVVALTFSRPAAASLRTRIHRRLLLEMQSDPARAEMWRRHRDAMLNARIGTFHSFCSRLIRTFSLEAGVDPEVTVGLEAERRQEEALDAHLRRLAFARDPDYGALLRQFSKKPVRNARQIMRLLLSSPPLREAAAHAATDRDEAARFLETTARELAPRYGMGGDETAAPLTHHGFLDTIALAFKLVKPVADAEPDPAFSLSYDNLERRALALLESDSDASRLIRRSISALLIDELQDTSTVQWRLIEAIARDERAALDASKLFLVGDEKQSIYGFRKANVTVLRKARDHASRSAGPFREQPLSDNFRTQPPLVDALNPVLRRLLTHGVAGDEDYVAQPQDLAPRRDDRGPVDGRFETRVVVGGKRPAAMGHVTRALTELVAGGAGPDSQQRIYEYSDIAILIPSRTPLPELETALQNDSIPYVIHSRKDFFAREEIRDTITLIDALANPRNCLALAGALRGPVFNLPDTALATLFFNEIRPLERWRRLLDGGEPQWAAALDEEDWAALRRGHALWSELAQRAGSENPAHWLRRALEAGGAWAAYATGRRGRQRIANLTRLLALVQEIGSEQGPSLRRLKRRLDEEQADDEGVDDPESHVNAGEGVQIMTIHAAKGLEFPAVVLPLAGTVRKNRGDVKTGSLLAPEHGPFAALVDPALIETAVASGEDGSESLYTWMKDRFSRSEEHAERLRLLYVAATRARDRLIVLPHIPESQSRLNLDKDSDADLWLRAAGVGFGDDGSPIAPHDTGGMIYTELTPGELADAREELPRSIQLPERVETDAAADPSVQLVSSVPELTLRLPLEAFAAYLANETADRRDALLAFGRTDGAHPALGVAMPESASETDGEHEPIARSDGAVSAGPPDVLRLSGTLFHRAVQRFGPGVGWDAVEPWADGAVRELAERSLREPILTRLRELIDAGGAHEWGNAAGARRELPVLLPLGPLLLRGRIDLAWREHAAAVALDLKTNDVDPAAVDELARRHGYDHQAKLYALALSASWELEQPIGRLLFFPSGAVREFAVGGDERRWYLAKADALSGYAREFHGSATPEY